MVALQIRDVPAEIRDALAERAARQGQSLQAYLLEVVTREAGFARNRALLMDLSWADSGGATVDDALLALDEARTERTPG